LIVVDASALYESIIETPHSAAIVRRIFGQNETLHAPHLIDLEIANTLRRYVLKRELSQDDADQAMGDLASIQLIRYPHTVLIARVWELRNNLTAYDASYVALSERLNAPLLTRDTALAAVRGHRARIELM
jgi:predicted nucleic acid-binding protein